MRSSGMDIILPNISGGGSVMPRSEEHTSELQSRLHLVCRLLLVNKLDVCRGERWLLRDWDGRTSRTGGTRGRLTPLRGRTDWGASRPPSQAVLLFRLEDCTTSDP